MSDLGAWLAQALNQQEAGRVVYGVVTDIAPFSVALDGSDISVPNMKKLGSYTPALNDVVAVWKTGPAPLVLGNVT